MWMFNYHWQCLDITGNNGSREDYVAFLFSVLARRHFVEVLRLQRRLAVVGSDRQGWK